MKEPPPGICSGGGSLSIILLGLCPKLRLMNLLVSVAEDGSPYKHWRYFNKNFSTFLFQFSTKKPFRSGTFHKAGYLTRENQSRRGGVSPPAF